MYSISSQTDVESDTEEDEHELDIEGDDVEFYEDKRASEDLEDLHSSRFRAEGQLMNYEEDPSFEGYLQVKVRTYSQLQLCLNNAGGKHVFLTR